MVTVSTLPNQSFVSGIPSNSQFFPTSSVNGASQNGSLVFAQAPLPQSGPMANPVYAQGVTGLQAETANEMTGGYESVLDTGGTVAGVAGDGLSTASAAAGGATDAATAGARGASDAATAGARGASDAAAAASGGADAAKGFARGAGRLLGPAAIGIDLIGGGLQIRNAWKDPHLTDSQRDQKVGEATVGTAGSIAGGAGGAWAGAAAGAALGSVVPVVGTAIGGVAGAIIGGFLGGKAGGAAGEAAGGSGAGKGIGGFINNLFGK